MSLPATEWTKVLKLVHESLPSTKPVHIFVSQAHPWWLLDEQRPMRNSIDRLITGLLLSSSQIRVRRLTLYDPPGTYLGSFLGHLSRDEHWVHQRLTDNLLDWLVDMTSWMALVDPLRQLSDERVAQRYECKQWILPELHSKDAADREAVALPPTHLHVGEDWSTGLGSLWSHERLIWLNGASDALDGLDGRRAFEVRSAMNEGGTYFMSIERQSARWWEPPSSSA